MQPHDLFSSCGTSIPSVAIRLTQFACLDGFSNFLPKAGTQRLPAFIHKRHFRTGNSYHKYRKHRCRSIGNVFHQLNSIVKLIKRWGLGSLLLYEDSRLKRGYEQALYQNSRRMPKQPEKPGHSHSITPNDSDYGFERLRKVIPGL